MARQKGIIKINGTLGDITFYKTKDGYMAREKGGVEASRIATDPAFQRTRENNSEFGRAGKAGKLLRNSLRTLYLQSADARMCSRMTQWMMKVIQADKTSIRGLRNVIDGETELLLGFEFNIRGKLSTTLFAPFTVEIDRAGGMISMSVPPFVPTTMLAAPAGTTHYKILSGAVEVDFEAETFVTRQTETALLPWNSEETVAIAHNNNVTAGSTKPLFGAVGVEFYQEVNGQMYPLKNGAHNPLSLVRIDGGV
ncbi:hypothetical protein ACI6PS_07975 [Flavobacterium sp. PLA-1-15]|uniref:hypothetical protein n=1 Tax=Flavobacterium sp. PLA-1-15 TaxID=3380533 RepID=UPI003B7C4D04